MGSSAVYAKWVHACNGSSPSELVSLRYVCAHNSRFDRGRSVQKSDRRSRVWSAKEGFTRSSITNLVAFKVLQELACQVTGRLVLLEEKTIVDIRLEGFTCTKPHHRTCRICCEPTANRSARN